MTLIEIPQWSTVNLIELVWLCSGALALVFALARLRPLSTDYTNARASGEPDLVIIARGYLRREIIRVGQAASIIGIGLYAALEPPAIPGPARVSITGLVITAALISIALLVALQSYLDWRDREGVRWILRARP